MKTVLSRQPWFVVLLPLFFVFHGFANNFHYLSIVDILPLAGLYTAASIFVYLLMRLPLRNKIRSALFAIFVYSHFIVPHLPVFFDSSGNRLPPHKLDKGPTIKDHYDHYLNNLGFANHLIRKLVTQIQQQTNHQAVILVMSDHGLRWPRHALQPQLANNNLNAVFLPGRQYSGWTDSTTNVNQFRILFNTLFDRQYQLLPDRLVNMGRR